MAAALAFSFGLGFAVTFNVSLSPPSLKDKGTPSSAGSSALLVDTKQSLLTSLDADFTSLTGRAVIIAEFAQSETIEHRIEQLAGLPEGSTVVSAATGTGTGGTAAGPAPPNFSASGVPQVTYTADGTSPIINISTEGPAGDTAFRLAKAAQQTLIEYTEEQNRIQAKATAPTTPQTPFEVETARQLGLLSTVTLRRLRAPNGGTIPATTSPKKAYAIGGGLSVLLCLVILFWDNLRTGQLATESAGRRGENVADRAAA